jgi:hypothetical protein
MPHALPPSVPPGVSAEGAAVRAGADPGDLPEAVAERGGEPKPAWAPMRSTECPVVSSRCWVWRLTWRQAVTKPLRLNLAFDVTVEGDTLSGVSKAGRLPAVTGRRRTA